MRNSALILLLLPATAPAQSVQPGDWTVTSKAVELVLPGTPGFLLNMAKGKTKTEHKCLLPDQAKAGIGALFVPKPEAKCSVERAQIAGGRIDHVMTCPQKDGTPARVVRTGTYTAGGFTARTTMTGQTKKGPSRIVADQVGARVGPTCRK